MYIKGDIFNFMKSFKVPKYSDVFYKKSVLRFSIILTVISIIIFFIFGYLLFYNNLLKNVESQTEQLKQMEEYNKILQDMNKNLSAAGNTLKLTINVETTAA